MKSMTSTRLLILVALFSFACSEDEPCDSTTTLENGSCAPLNADAAPVIMQGAEFGDSCTDDVEHSECAEPAAYCAVMPGSQGYCTATGCVEDASVCPEGWGCIDLSLFDPTLPSVCVQP